MIIYNRTEYSELTNSQYRKEKRRLQIELLKLQEWTIDTNQRIAILLEGRDAAGKGSTIQRFIENLMPKATKIVELGVTNKIQEKNVCNSIKYYGDKLIIKLNEIYIHIMTKSIFFIAFFMSTSFAGRLGP